MRAILALLSIFFGLSAASAAEPPPTTSESAEPVRRVELNWSSIGSGTKSAVNAKQAVVNKIRGGGQQIKLPKPVPLMRYQDENGQWVIGHRRLPEVDRVGGEPK